jgi:hypothetical protein
VDHVVLFDDATPATLIRTLRPDARSEVRGVFVTAGATAMPGRIPASCNMFIVTMRIGTARCRQLPPPMRSPAPFASARPSG